LPPLSPNFWLTERERLLAELLPALQSAALAGIAQSAAKLGPLGLAFDPGLVNAAAAKWAREHTDQLLNLLGTTNQQVVGQVVANWIETPGATLGDLDAALAPVLDGDVARADSISVSETTRAIAQGNIMSFTESGAIAPPMWTDKTGTRPFGPPGHVRCRCDTGMARYKDLYLIFWTTNKDFEVCQRPIKTPWGIVQGCRALQGVCISAGEYLGRKIV